MKKALWFSTIITLLISSIGYSQCSYLINENFRRDGDLPTGWAQNGIASTSWSAGSAAVRLDAANDYFTTPLLTTPGTLTFDINRPTASTHSGNWTFKVESSPNGTTWTAVTGSPFSGVTVPATPSVISRSIDLSALSNVYIRLTYVSNVTNTAAWRFISNFKITDRTGNTITPCDNTGKTINCGTTYTFLDPGGLGDYGYQQDYTTTFTPGVTGGKVQVVFSSFSLKGDGCSNATDDWLKVYNGGSISDPLIGCYDQSTAPGTITSTATDGKLTFVFKSGNTLVESGWKGNVTITTSTPAGLSYSANPARYCMGAAITSNNPSFSSGSAASYTVTPSLPAGLSIDATTGVISGTPTAVANPSTGNYVVTASSGCISASKTVEITVARANAGTDKSFSCGGSAILDGSGSNVITTLLNQDFESGIGSWTALNSTTGGTPANANWTIRTGSFGGSPMSSSKYIVSNSGYNGNGETGAGSSGNNFLTSPAFSTVGYASANLSFKHFFYSVTDGSCNMYVEICIDGVNWLNLYNTSSTEGTGTLLGTRNIDLTAYVNQSSVKIRFRYNTTNDYFWVIDDVIVTGGNPPTYSWSPATGLSATNIASPTASPSSTSTYTLTVTANGCSASDATVVTVTATTPTVANINTLITPNSFAVGDYLWKGSDANWATAANWYTTTDGTTIVAASAVPATTTKAYIVQPTASVCVSSAGPTVNALSNALNVFIASGATLNGGSNTLNVYGNWTNNGTFTPGTGTIYFKDGANAVITGATSFYILTVGKTSGTSIGLNHPVSVTNTLNLISGNINTTATNLLTVGVSSSDPGSINWTAGNAMVVGPLKRFFATSANNTQTSGIFPVGNGTYNRYAQVNLTSANTVGSITVKYVSGLPFAAATSGLPLTVNGQLIQNAEEEGYWSIEPAIAQPAQTYDLILRGQALTTPTTTGSLRIIKSVNHSSWDNAGIGSNAGASGAANDFTIRNNGMTGFSYFNIGSNSANPLPVILTHFSADCEKATRIEWTTASEQNSDKFLIQKSRELSEWIVLETVQAAGNSTHNIDYASQDENPFDGISYYRLIQRDLNGVEKIYGPVSVECKNPENTISVFPNPSKGNFTVEILSMESKSNVHLRLIDMSGKTIISQTENLVEGLNHILFYKDFAKGIYLVQVSSESNDFKPVKVVIE